ncbi:MAG: endo-1,4-beta-xylanase, partial [Anaerolineae bacterium]|nr:endo-1,4-beta-xylanase [Phycisphaerae bacterium]
MKRVTRCVLAVAALSAVNAQAQTTINGKDLIVRSTGAASGNAWTLGSTGYIGTYVTVPAGGGTVSFTINAAQGAAGANNPHLNLVVADTKVGFSLTSPSANNFAASTYLPGGTYFVRTERDYVQPTQASTRSAVINSLTVSGATVVNTNNSANALAASDTYVQNFRRGPAHVALTGPGNIPLLAGTQVQVDHKRHAFMFGTAVPGFDTGSVNAYLGGNNTAQQTNYQSRLNQNFNAVVPENVGKWSSNETTRDVNTMGGVDAVLNYAQSRNMRARMHNMIWGTQQPTWATTLLSSAAGGNATAKSDLRTEISERVGYYVGTGLAADRANKYAELDIYNESYHTGVQTAGSYWNVYGAAGIADVYREARAIAPNVKMFVNEYNIYSDTNDGSKYANYYRAHTEQLRDAGFNAGYGDVVGGIGTQYYVNNSIETGDPNAGTANNGAHNAARIMQTMQALSTNGLPINLTEFGVKAGATQATAATMLSDSLRVTFGNANATGFMMWGFQSENGGANLFAPAAALYTLNTSNWNTWTITDAGKAWQDLLGIQDWDGNPNNAWTTHVTPSVNADGSIDFTGFYGDYNIGNQSGFSNLNVIKGTNNYQLSLALPPQWSMWNTSASGNWTGANWTAGGVPNAIGQTAYFADAAGARTVAIDTPQAIGMLAFNSAAGYTLIGAGTITMQGAAGQVAMYVATGSHAVSAPVVLNDDLNVTIIPASSTLTVSNLQSSSHAISKNGAGALAVNNIRAASLTINAGTVAILTDGSAGATSRVGTLSLSPTSTLDLNDNDLVIQNGDSAAMAALIAQSRNAGAWDQTGI